MVNFYFQFHTAGRSPVYDGQDTTGIVSQQPVSCEVGVINNLNIYHYCDVIINTIASQITSLTIVCLTVNSGIDQSKHQSSASLAFVKGIHRRPVNSPYKGPVMRKMFPFDDVIMQWVSGITVDMNPPSSTVIAFFISIFLRFSSNKSWELQKWQSFRMKVLVLVSGLLSISITLTLVFAIFEYT